MPVLFARIGWMRFYGGPVPGDERPIRGGAYNENNIGGEVYNFRVTKGHLYGFFKPTLWTAVSWFLSQLTRKNTAKSSWAGTGPQ